MLRRRAAAALLLSLLAGAALGVPTASAATVRVVDDDGRATPSNCGANAAAPDRIQAAINQSSPGDTIRVCPGDYTQRLRIPASKDGLSLIAVRSFEARVRAPSPVGDPAILLRIRADDVTVIGFTFLAPAPGVATSGGTSCHVQAMISIVADDAVIRGNRFRPEGPATFGPCGYSFGLMLGDVPIGPTGDPSFPPASAFVGYNAFDDFQVGGVGAFGPETELVAVANTIRFIHENYPEDIDADPGSRSAVSYHTMRGAQQQGFSSGLVSVSSAGIGLAFGAQGVVRRSGISSGHDAEAAQIRLAGSGGEEGTPMLDAGIYVLGTPLIGTTGVVDGPIVDAVDNDIVRAEAGIYIESSAFTRLRRNLVTYGFFGIALSDAFRNRIVGNLAASNFFGLYADEDTDDNRFRDNQARGNLIEDCTDRSDDGGTAGTANTWVGNRGNTDDPDGICEREVGP